MTSLVLASASQARADLLRNAGVEIEIAPAAVDEEEIKIALRAEGASPRDQADALAEMKSRRVSARNPQRLVLGADQVLGFGDEAMDKPRDLAEARSQLAKLRGGRHQLFSAAVISLNGDPIWRHIGTVRMTMRPFSDEFLDDYVERSGDDLLQTVGGYKLEGLGAQLFSRIDGDYFAVLGLPLIETLGFLRVRGMLLE